MKNEEDYYEKYWLKGSLALESFQDDMHWHNVLDEEKDKVIDNCFEFLNELDLKANLASVKEKFAIRKRECEEIKKVIDYLGKEYFTFYDDGDVICNHLFIKQSDN
jgi:hypothetical protein